MDTKHTPVPWRFDKHENWSEYYGNIVGSYGRDERGIENIRTISCQLKHGTGEENEANAEFTIRACNNFYALLDVCKKIAKRDRLDQCGKPIHKELLEAIAKAEE